MAEMKAKHAFGTLEKIDEALSSGKIDSYDILFVKDADGKPYVGWISKDGQKEIVDPYTEVSKLETNVETKLATKANSEDVETLEGQIATKADASEVEALQTAIATKVDATTVQTMISEAAVGAVEVVEF